MSTDLEEQRDFLLRSLDDLEADRAAGAIDDAEYRALKDDYTARAAAVLRALDAEDQPVPDGPERAATPRKVNRAAVVIVAVVLLAVGAGIMASRSSDERGAGEVATGGTRGEDGGEATSSLEEVRRLEEDGDLLGAVKELDEILREDPTDVEALSYRGWIRVNLAAQVDGEDAALLGTRGEADIDRAIRLDPGYPFAHFYKGFVLRSKGDTEGAAREWELFLDMGAPEQMRPVVRELIEELESGG